MWVKNYKKPACLQLLVFTILRGERKRQTCISKECVSPLGPDGQISNFWPHRLLHSNKHGCPLHTRLKHFDTASYTCICPITISSPNLNIPYLAPVLVKLVQQGFKSVDGGLHGDGHERGQQCGGVGQGNDQAAEGPQDHQERSAGDGGERGEPACPVLVHQHAKHAEEEVRPWQGMSAI